MRARYKDYLPGVSSREDELRRRSSTLDLEIDLDVAAGSVRVWTNLLVSPLDQLRELRLGRAGILRAHLDRNPETTGMTGSMETVQVTTAFLAFFFCWLAMKSSTPPKLAA
jgi:hypothetical protein